MTALTFDPQNIFGTPGFFRVGKATNGQWWLLDPAGAPFYVKGCTSINRAGTPGGRNAMPGGPYAATVDAKYGWLKNRSVFAVETIKRIRGWGFNSLGAWVTDEFYERGMPYTEILDFWKLGVQLPGLVAADANVHGGTAHTIPDVFDEKWESLCDAHARDICTPRRTSRLLIGYFTDNEISFDDSGDALLARCRRAGPDTAAGRRALDFTGSSREWVKIFASRYFQVASDCIRRHDPNHLRLGCRFGGPPSTEVFAAITPWVDVVSANNYRDTFYERMDVYYRATGKPVLNGEFNWRSDYFKPPTGLTVGEVSLKRIFTHPGVVGYTWYRWNHSKKGGLVDMQDNPYLENTDLLTRLNLLAENHRRNSLDVPG